MPKIKNMGTATMRFGEGIIVSGSDEGGVALAVAADVSNEYVVTIDNDQGSAGHVLKLFTDGNGSNTRVLEMEDGDGDTIFRARADGRFGFGPDGVDSMGAGTFVVGIDNSSHTSDIAISRRLQHLGDSNTYMDFPSNDNITFVAGGSEELKIASDAILVKQYIKHDGDEDTLINFADDKIILKAGNIAMVTAEQKANAPHEVTINDGSNNIDFVVKGNGSGAGNPGMKFDASTNKLGINGVGTPAEALHVWGNIKVDGTEPYLQFAESGTDRAQISVNDSDNLVIHNQTINKHIVFKCNDAGQTREGLRLDGAVPEVVVNQASESLVDFRVESDNNTHMLFVDGSTDRVGIDTSSPSATFHVHGDSTISPNTTETKNALQGTSTSTAALRDETFTGLSNQDFSFSCWVYANDSNSVGLSSNTRVVFFGSGEHHNLKLGVPDVQIIYENHAGSNSTATFDTNLAEGNWYHIVAHFDVSDLSTGVPKLWVNGVEYNHGGFTAPGGTAATIDDVAIYLDDGGAMQDAVFWKKLLTQAEINEIYDDGFWKDPSKTSIAGEIVSWFKLGYEDSWAGLGFSAGDTLSGTINLPDEIGTNEFTFTNENEFALLARSINRRTKSDFNLDSTFLDGQVTIKDSMDVTNASVFNGSITHSFTDVNSSTVVSPNDYVLRCTQGSAITITLPAKSESVGRILVIKDALGNASSNNITIDGDGSDTIDGSATYVISHNKEGVTLMCDGINGWMLLSRIRP